MPGVFVSKSHFNILLLTYNGRVTKLIDATEKNETPSPTLGRDHNTQKIRLSGHSIDDCH